MRGREGFRKSGTKRRVCLQCREEKKNRVDVWLPYAGRLKRLDDFGDFARAWYGSGGFFDSDTSYG